MAVLALHQCGKSANGWMVELVAMVAAQAGLALSQARAYERISALAKREALIDHQTIRSSLDPQDIFPPLPNSWGKLLHWTAVHFLCGQSQMSLSSV